MNDYIKCKIDGEEVILDTFTEDEIPNVIISNTITSEEGWHMMTDIEYFNGSDVLLATTDADMNFSVVASRTTEINIDLLFLEQVESRAMTANINKRLVKCKADGSREGGSREDMTHGFVYIKSLPFTIPKGGDDVTVKMIGVLGIPEDELHFYEDDDVYSQHPVKAHTKCVFSVQHIHNDNIPVWFNYDWNSKKPLVINYTKTGKEEDVDVFKLQVLRVLEIDGVKAIREVLSTTDWRFTLRGNEDFVVNEKGFVEFSYLPDGWESEMNYQFNY